MAENEASEEEENEEADLIADQQICRLDPIRWYSRPFQIFQDFTLFVVTSCMAFPLWFFGDVTLFIILQMTVVSPNNQGLWAVMFCKLIAFRTLDGDV